MPAARNEHKRKPVDNARLRLGPSIGVHAVKIDWRLAEALAIQKLHGDDAPCWVAERIGALALAGDAEGVERFKAIAARLSDLLGAPRQ